MGSGDCGVQAGEGEKRMVTIGLDLGQKRDHTAIVVVERPQAHPYLTRPERTLYVRAAERLPLGLSYSEIVLTRRFGLR